MNDARFSVVGTAPFKLRHILIQILVIQHAQYARSTRRSSASRSTTRPSVSSGPSTEISSE